MGGVQVSAVGGVAVGILMLSSTGAHSGQNGLLALGIVIGNGNGQKLISGQTIRYHFAGQYLLQGILVREKTKIQGVGQGLPIFIVALHGEHPVKAVDFQLQGGVDVNADNGHGDEVGPPQSKTEHQQKTGGHREHRPVGKAPGLGIISGFFPKVGERMFFQFRLGVDLTKGLFQWIMHLRHLPTFPLTAAWRV